MTSSDLLSAFAYQFDWCAVCWSRKDLEIHHLVGGVARVHLRENLLRLCKRCHTNLHSYGGEDCLTKGACLCAKLEADDEYYSPKALAALRHRAGLSYGPEPMPPWAYEDRRRNGTPQDYINMGAFSRNKGKRGELECAAELNEILPHANARRGKQFSGGDESPDVVAPGLKGLWIEVKRREKLRLREWVDVAADQAGDLCPVVAHKKNGEGWLITIRMEDIPRFASGVLP